MNTIIFFALLYLALAFLSGWADSKRLVFERKRVENFKWYAAYYSFSVFFWPLHIFCTIIEKWKIFGKERIGFWAWIVFCVVLSIKTSNSLAGSAISAGLLGGLFFIVFFVVSIIWMGLLVGLLSIIGEETSDRIVDYLL